MTAVPVDWIKGHIDVAHKLIKDIEALLKVHHMEDAATELQHALYPLNRARNLVEKVRS